MRFSITAPRCYVDDFKKEIETMTNIEKESANQELKGCLKPIGERPEFLIEKLIELRLCADQDQTRDKAAYDEAQRRIPGFANSISFLLMFLRATRFDVQLAAKKLINYWEYKVKLFGPVIAFREGGRVLLSDLNGDDLAAYESLGMFCLPKNKNHRGVLFSRRQNWMISSSQSQNKNLIRLVWYLLQGMTDDTQVQKKGIVLILYNFGAFSTNYYDRILENLFGGIISDAFPCRVAGVHLCFDSKVYDIVLPFVLYSFHRDIRSRLRLHKSEWSLWEALTESGIRKEEFPIQFGGKSSIDITSWEKEQEKQENTLLLSQYCLVSQLSLKKSILSCYQKGTRTVYLKEM